MLAQNFKTPADLRISSDEFGALVKALGMFERNEVPSHLFDMVYPGDQEKWGDQDCGTPACILGWARYAVRRRVFDWISDYPMPLRRLFMMDSGPAPEHHMSRSPFLATREEAAIALRNYLTVGEPRWQEAMAEG